MTIFFSGYIDQITEQASAEYFDAERRAKLEKKVQALKLKMGIDTSVLLIEVPGFPLFSAIRVPFSSKYQVVYYGQTYPKGLQINSKGETAILAHELAHIKLKHSSYIPLIRTIEMVIHCSFHALAAVQMQRKINLSIPATISAFLLYGALISYFRYLSREMESEADQEALNYLSNSEKKGFIQAFQSLNTNLAPSFYQFFPWLSTHPSNISRIEKIRESIQLTYYERLVKAIREFFCFASPR